MERDYRKMIPFFVELDKVIEKYRLYLQHQLHLGGGIGRRARLRGVCPRTCGFDSHPRYEKPCNGIVARLFFLQANFYLNKKL